MNTKTTRTEAWAYLAYGTAWLIAAFSSYGVLAFGDVSNDDIVYRAILILIGLVGMVLGTRAIADAVDDLAPRR